MRRMALTGLLVLLFACDKPSSAGDTPAVATPTTAPHTKEAPPTAPPPVEKLELTLDLQGVNIAGDRVAPLSPDGSRRLKEAVAKMNASGKSATVVALRSAKTPDVSAVVDAFGAAGVTDISVRTQDRTKKDSTIRLLPVQKAGKLPECTVVGMVLKDRSTASWHIRGGVATKYGKGMAGPDMTLTLDGITKQVASCTSTVFVISGDDSVEWGLTFDLLAIVAKAEPPLKVTTFVLPKESPVAGRLVKIGD